MDTPGNEKIISIVRMIGPEFDSVPDDDVSLWIELQKPIISQKRFGANYDLAMALLACHAMKMAGHGETSMGKLTDSARLASISEGGVSVSFASTTASGGADAEYQLTSYGLQFIALRARCIVPILIR